MTSAEKMKSTSTSAYEASDGVIGFSAGLSFYTSQSLPPDKGLIEK
jgi:hypothetical protein